MEIKKIYEKLVFRLIKDILDIAMQFEDCSVTSWIRSVKHNKDVGGAKTSFHLDGLAIDLIIDEGPQKLSTQAKIIKILTKKGYKIITNNKCLHIQYNLPYFIDFERKNCFTHIKMLTNNFTIFWDDYLKEIKNNE